MSDATCSIDGCEGAHYARTWCRSHYYRWVRWADPLGSPPPFDRWAALLSKVEQVDAPGLSTPCWVFGGWKQKNGYGRMRLRGETVPAHRLAYELARGPIPAGLYICHRCDNPPCVNPDHLFAGTASDNTRDMLAKGRRANINQFVARTHCSQGHPFDEENTAIRIRGAKTWRVCRICNRERSRRRAKRR